MANFLDALQQKRAQLAQPTQGLGQTEQTQRLLRARTGKATAEGLASSNIQEQAAVRETERTREEELLPQLQQQQEAQVQQAQGIQAREQEALQGVKQQRQFDTLQNRIKLNNILQNLQQERGQISTEQQQAALEQAGFILSMQDKKYVDELLRVGQQRRLDNKMNLLNELQDQIFGDTLSVLQEKLGQQNVLASTRRTFQEQLSDMSIEEAIRVAELEIRSREELAALERENLRYGAQQTAKAAAIQSKYAGLSGLLSGGIQAGGMYADRQKQLKQEEQQRQLSQILARQNVSGGKE